MATEHKPDYFPGRLDEGSEVPAQATGQAKTKAPRWKQVLGIMKTQPGLASTSVGSSTDDYDEIKAKPEKWSLGVLNDKETEEVPGRL